MRRLYEGLCVLAALGVFATAVHAQDGAAEPMPTERIAVSFTPTDYAQLALWVERADGEFLATLRLTEAVSYRGIGNRPGASQMNSGFRWPYGRREGVLPIWAHRRLSAPGAEPFRRVIFQDRNSEGLASRTSNDQSPDDYYCLSFDRARSSKEALDAVSCASVFSSDKGRFVTDDDLAAGYAEPYVDVETGEAYMRPLSKFSLYPPRRDVTHCGESCFDHDDVRLLAQHARDVMPDIDAVTMATPQGGVPQTILYAVPREWQPGDYRACLEINVEGDYNQAFNDSVYPTPMAPVGTWDNWAISYGYAYRGQPSVVYCTDFSLGGDTERSYVSEDATGSVGTWDTADDEYGALSDMTGMTNDPSGAPGSGADRLLRDDDGVRLRVEIKPPLSCMANDPPTAVDALRVHTYPDERHAHHWAEMEFLAAADDDGGVFGYQVRFSTNPIVDDESFMRAEPAKNASIEAEELLVPGNVEAGEPIQVDMGGLIQNTHYFVAVRAIDTCAETGPIRVAELDTPNRIFATVTPCFVATAAWGSPLAKEVGVLRRMRDRHLMTNAVGRFLVHTYYTVGPVLARYIAKDDGLRDLARTALEPVVGLARWLDD